MPHMAKLAVMLSERIFTRRLVMRRICEADLELMLAWSNSQSACGPYLTPEQHTAKTLREKFSGYTFWKGDDKTFLIENRSSGLPIGTIHYWLRQNQLHTTVVSVKIADPGERGKGYGTEAQKFLIIYLFDKVGVKKVEMYTDIDNVPQQHCLVKLGFTNVESLTYNDRQILRTGYLFQLRYEDYLEKSSPVF